ncbi:hypothetical protein GALMADRAFT_227288 [Galerina marginata CBS 339.88]|uniref:F-box domain-containing protein n=1 Tax=Galerina marginata (strain CBS 339.88) TaxID=685588 RepID=A0A067T7L7_GALM3|nr:hypothetical protein GALMADRAFT_227288 [Galerina marginata CBS 339.88]
MTTPTLPQELIELIIESLATGEDDNERRKTALKACALTSWSFFLPARKHRFAELHLFEDDGEVKFFSRNPRGREKLEMFLQLLVRDPCHALPGQPLLASHIRSLVIHLSGIMADFSFFNTLDSALAPILLHFLSNCRLNVKKLLISVPDAKPYLWESLDKDVKCALLQFSSVTDLNIRHINALPTEVILNYANIESLSLEGVTLDDRNIISSAPSSSRGKKKLTGPVLERLSLTRRYCLMRTVWSFETTYFDLSCLRSLHLSPNHHPEVWVPLQSLPSLRFLSVLDINYENSSYFLPRQADFGLLGGLETLELGGRLGGGPRDAGLLPLSRLKIFNMNEAFTPSSIRTLIFSILWYVSTPESEKKHFWPRSGWKTVGNALSSTRFPNLETVHLNLSFMYGSDSGPLDPTLAVKHLQMVKKKIHRLFPSISKETPPQVEITFTIRPLSAAYPAA